MNFNPTTEAQEADVAIEQTLSNYEIERRKPMPNEIHGAVQAQLIYLLRMKYIEQYLCLSEVSLDTAPASTPDLCLYRKRKLDYRKAKAKSDKMPITTIEIVSPSQTVHEMCQKVREVYFTAGVKSAWIVVPEFKGIHLLLLNQQDQFFATGELIDPTTKIKLDISEVFVDLV